MKADFTDDAKGPPYSADKAAPAAVEHQVSLVHEYARAAHKISTATLLSNVAQQYYKWPGAMNAQDNIAEQCCATQA